MNERARMKRAVEIWVRACGGNEFLRQTTGHMARVELLGEASHGLPNACMGLFHFEHTREAIRFADGCLCRGLVVTFTKLMGAP